MNVITGLRLTLRVHTAEAAANAIADSVMILAVIEIACFIDFTPLSSAPFTSSFKCLFLFLKGLKRVCAVGEFEILAKFLKAFSALVRYVAKHLGYTPLHHFIRYFLRCSANITLLLFAQFF